MAGESPEPLDVVMIDNYDSFTFNLVQYLEELGARVTVFRHDKITVDELERWSPRRIVISPGPGAPKDAGISCEVISRFAGRIPILGVCLGLQCMFEVFGGVVAHAGEIMHGKASVMTHDGQGVFRGVPTPFKAVRYHSLAGVPATLPACLAVTCTTANGIIQGVRHRDYSVEGVQFHPESVLTEHGYDMLRNFLAVEGGSWGDAPTQAASATSSSGGSGATGEEGLADAQSHAAAAAAGTGTGAASAAPVAVST